MIKVGENAVAKNKNYGTWGVKYKDKWYNLPNIHGKLSGKDLIEAVFEAGMEKCKKDLKEILGVKG